jgi:phosphinothricin acetyltransferase
MSAIETFSETDVQIRDAEAEDAHAIAAIYAWHVLNGRASFEEVPPGVDEMRQRISAVTSQGLPWLVALYRGIVVGFSYATLYRPRPG